MELKKLVVTATIIGALGFGAGGIGGGIAIATPTAPAPLQPRHDDPCPPLCGNGPGRDRGNNNHGNNDHGNKGPDWQRPDWDKGSWWASNRHDWWDDRNGPPPWGWGPPPPAQWSGPPPWIDPHPINYWGWNATPVWDDGFRSWGIWLFGIWIPLVGIGVT